MPIHTDSLHPSVAECVIENTPEEDITSVYVGEQVGHSHRPQMHRIYLTDVAVLYQTGPDGYEAKGYQIPYQSSEADDIDSLGSVQMAAFVDNQIQALSPDMTDSHPQPIKFEGNTNLIDAVISSLENNDVEEFEIIKSE